MFVCVLGQYLISYVCVCFRTMPDQLRDQLILTIERTFQYSQEQAEKLYMELMLCVKKKELVRFKIHEQRHEKNQ